MPLIASLKEWLREHGSAAALRDHVALVKEQKADLEAKYAILDAALKQRQKEKEVLELKVSELQIFLEDATKQIKNLESVRVALKDQTQLEARIRQLQAKNTDLERMLRLKSLGW